MNMEFLTDMIDEVHDFFGGLKNFGEFSEFVCDAPARWPAARQGDIIMKTETAIELGHPSEESCSFFLWTNDLERIKDCRISLAGPDLGNTNRDRLPFAKVVMIGGHGFDEKTSYDRFHEMDSLRYDVALKGYMMRSVSQYMREWSRISKEALKNNFSISFMGSALIHKLKELDYVDKVELVYVTSSTADVRRLKTTGDRVTDYISTLRKVMTDSELDCTCCEFQNICEEVEELRDIHKSNQHVYKQE